MVTGMKKTSCLMQNVQQQLTHTANEARSLATRAQNTVIIMRRQQPLFIRISAQAYHNFGLKHLMLITFFLLYIFFGAFLFLRIEQPIQNGLKSEWMKKISRNREVFVANVLKEIFNNTNYLIYLKGRTSRRVETHLSLFLEKYEKNLSIKWSDQKLIWNYWNAVVFAGTLCTTIGYGHIYPTTQAGRILTMIYSLGGIPLVLLLLQDLGRLLTIFMKYPWFQFKRGIRRITRLAIKQSLEDIIEIEAEERKNLSVFDIPIPVAVILVIIWLWICSTTICYLDENWTLLDAFYFFFISLSRETKTKTTYSTIGLGDIVPSSPDALFTMFGLIIIGLSLVSMVINLIQTKMLSTYESKLRVQKQDTCQPIFGVIQCVNDMQIVPNPCSIPQCPLNTPLLNEARIPSNRNAIDRSDSSRSMSSQVCISGWNDTAINSEDYDLISLKEDRILLSPMLADMKEEWWSADERDSLVELSL